MKRLCWIPLLSVLLLSGCNNLIPFTRHSRSFEVVPSEALSHEELHKEFVAFKAYLADHGAYNELLPWIDLSQWVRDRLASEARGYDGYFAYRAHLAEWEARNVRQWSNKNLNYAEFELYHYWTGVNKHEEFVELFYTQDHRFVVSITRHDSEPLDNFSESYISHFTANVEQAIHRSTSREVRLEPVSPCGLWKHPAGCYER